MGRIGTNGDEPDLRESQRLQKRHPNGFIELGNELDEIDCSCCKYGEGA